MRTIAVRLSILLLCSIAVREYSLGQSPNFVVNYSTSQDEMPITAIDCGDGRVIVACRQGTFPPSNSDYRTLLLKLDEWGNIDDSLVIENATGNCYINSITRTSDDNFICIGSRQETYYETSVWLFKIDTDLNMIWERTYKTNCQTLGAVQGFSTSYNNILAYGDGQTGTTTTRDLFIYEANSDGDSVLFRFYPDPSVESAWSMAEDTTCGRYLLMIDGSYQVSTYSWGQVLSVNYNLDIEDIDSIPGNYLFYYNILSYKNSLILTGQKVIVIAPMTTLHLLGIEKTDTTLSVNNSLNFGSQEPDTVSFPAYFKNVDTSPSHHIYYGGTYNQDKDIIFSYYDSWLFLNKLDSNLTLQWQKFYGGDMYYGLWGIKATNDGGCLLLGSTFDDQIQYNERDIIIIKVDSNGLVTSNGQISDIKFHDAIVYPNPGSDQLFIRSGSQIFAAQFTLVDMNGKRVSETAIRQALTQIPTAALPAGTYFWSIRYKNKMIESGKWILSRQ